MVQLLHIDPDEFLVDTFRLGRAIYEAGYRPGHAISIWRGGTPVGLGVDAYFRAQGVRINHTTIATDSYLGIDQQGEVMVKNLEHLVQVVCPEDSLLIIDDVFESGNTIKKIVGLLNQMARSNTPREIIVGVVHNKPKRRVYDELPVISLQDIAENIWIDYPHELADLVSNDDPEDTLLRKKSEAIWEILHSAPPASTSIEEEKDYHYVSSKELLLDCIRLGVKISKDKSYRPDFLIALWPGGIISGLPVHEVYKYFLAKSGGTQKPPDHISINTYPTRLSYESQIIGLHYLEERINKDDNILIIDTTFHAGRVVNDVINHLQKVLRRNLSQERIKVASVYYNPDDTTWRAHRGIEAPHYYLKTTSKEIVYPASIHKLPRPKRDLKALNPALWNVLYGEG